MTIYTTPDFEIEALDLDHVPDQREIDPGGDTNWRGPLNAELRLVGTRRKYQVGIQIGDDDDGTIGASIWTITDTANENLAAHAEDGGLLKVIIEAINFRARIIVSRHSDAPTIGDLFRHEPLSWGLRGDSHLWKNMRDHFDDWLLPDSVEELDRRITHAFQQLTGHSIGSEEPFFLSQHDTGGMSSGHICPDFWRTAALERLREQLAYDKGWKRPNCPSCGSAKVAKIVYGYPGPDMFEDSDRGDIVLGGCCVTENDSEWHCKDCELEWWSEFGPG